MLGHRSIVIVTGYNRKYDTVGTEGQWISVWGYKTYERCKHEEGFQYDNV